MASVAGAMPTRKPHMGKGGLANISFGFFGIQIGFVLQNSNMSRIFQTVGASLDDLPALWVAAPLTGLIVQPIVGHLSDKTWNRFGRRRPYFTTGAVLAALSLFLMPFAPLFATPLLFAAALLWVLDASLNIAMEPFRAFVGDMLDKSQHATGYAVQTAFIGAGAVVAAIFPWLLEQFGVSNVAAAGEIPDTVRWSFWAGAAALLFAVMWTVFTTKEYSPEEQTAFASADGAAEESLHAPAKLAEAGQGPSMAWIALGSGVAGATWAWGLEKELYLLGALLAAYGLLRGIGIVLAKGGRETGMLASIVGDFSGMPDLMKRLALVQFFSWSALFIMWIYSGPIVSQYFYGSADPTTVAYNEGANWWNVIYTVQNGVAAVAALVLLPFMAKRLGKVVTHMTCLLLGALGFLAYFVLRDPNLLIVAEVLKGIAWASILAMPYAILASSLPQAKLGIYMGLFNVFIVVPQLLVATVMGTVMKAFFPEEPVWTMLFAAASWTLAAFAMLRLRGRVPG